MFAEVSPALDTRLEKAVAPGKTWRKTLERILFFKASEVWQQQMGPCSFPLLCPRHAAGWLVAMGCCAEPGCSWEKGRKTRDLPKPSPHRGAHTPLLLCCAEPVGHIGGVPGGDLPWGGGDGKPSFSQAEG